MSFKRFLSWSALLLAVTFGGTEDFAADTPSPQEPTTKGEEPAKAPEPAKQGFFGDRFALYLAVAGGGAWTERSIDSSITTSAVAVSLNELDINEAAFGRLTAGWQLPLGRGRFLLTIEGVRETGYDFDAEGREAQVVVNVGEDGTLTSLPNDTPVRWWRTKIKNGSVTADLTVPIIGANDEVIYDAEDPRLNAHFQGTSAKDLQNSIQTWDLLYQREFGGRRWSARWTAGGRYFTYKGVVPAAAWLNDGDLPGYGFTDGVALHVIPVKQDATAWGPTGSLEAQLHLWRNRVTLYAQGRTALVYERLECDTGDFFTLVRGPDGFFPSSAHLSTNRVKTVWHVTAEIGARFRILEGFSAEIGYQQTSYQDSVLVPTDIFIPKLIAEAPLGTSALYNTRDLNFGVIHAGAAFQF